MTDWKVDVPCGSKGPWEVSRYEVTPRDPANLRYALQGRGCAPGTYTVLRKNGAVWMSDTTAEVRDHYAPVNEARRRGGRCLVMGLGLGMVVRQLLALPQVEHVDVVEIDGDLIDLVGPTYEGPRCMIHHDDALTVRWPKGTRWSVVWHDIWQDICEDNLPEMTRLARSYGQRCDWQGFWSKDYILRQRRATANAWWR